jgi:hypothetical protein
VSGDIVLEIQDFDSSGALAAAQRANDAATAAATQTALAATATQAATDATTAAATQAALCVTATEDADAATSEALQAIAEADAATQDSIAQTALAATATIEANTARDAANDAAANADARYLISGGVNGLVGANETIVRHVPAEAITIPAGFTSSVGYCGVTPTAQRVWSVKKNGVEFGTITWNIGSNVPTFAAAAETSFNGTTDRITVVASATADATLADATITIRGVTAS